LLRNACANAIADGVTSCVVFDAHTNEVRAGVDHGGLDGSGALFDILKGVVPVRDSEAGAGQSPTRQALIVGAQHTAFACATASGKWLVLIVALNSFSVALGWSLLRRVAEAAEVPE
jgi:hypothetical protein